MRLIVSILVLTFAFTACKKQVGGPRKLTAVGHIEYSFSTGIITKVFYNQEKDDRIFKIRINRDYTLGADVSGTWAESGAQILLKVDGKFGPNSPLTVDYGYYETRDNIAIEGKEVSIRDFTKDTYFIAVTKGTIGGNQYYRQFVFD